VRYMTETFDEMWSTRVKLAVELLSRTSVAMPAAGPLLGRRTQPLMSVSYQKR
jgi:hypothetical protein